MFPILQSPHDVALIFRTCQLHTAWELLHENGGNERQAAWHAFTKPPLFNLPLLSFYLYTTFKSGIAAAGEPIPSE